MAIVNHARAWFGELLCSAALVINVGTVIGWLPLSIGCVDSGCVSNPRRVPIKAVYRPDADAEHPVVLRDLETKAQLSVTAPLDKSITYVVDYLREELRTTKPMLSLVLPDKDADPQVSYLAHNTTLQPVELHVESKGEVVFNGKDLDEPVPLKPGIHVFVVTRQSSWTSIEHQFFE